MVAPTSPVLTRRDGRRWRAASRIAIGAALVVVFAVPSAVQTQPPPNRLTTRVTPNGGDPLFVTWTLAWESHALFHHPSDVMAANIFYPRRDAVAWSDNLLAAVPVFGLVKFLAGGRLLLAYNIVTLIGYTGVALAVYLLAMEVFTDRAGALVAATLFSLSAARSAAVGHTQLCGFLFVPLALVALMRFLRTRRLRWAVAFGVSAAATWLVTAYYAVLLALVVAAFVLVWVAQHRGRVGPGFWRGAGAGVLVAGALVAPTLPAYVRLQRAGFFRRTGADQLGVVWSDFGRLPPSLLYRAVGATDSLTRYDRGDLYPGLVLVGLLVVAGVALWRDRRKLARGDALVRPSWTWPVLAGAVPCAALIIGPRNGVVSAPFTVLKAVVPGVSSLRDLDRFWVYPLLCLALAAGWGMHRLAGGCPRRWRPALVVAVVALTWCELLFRPPSVAVDLSAQATASNRALAQLPAGAVLELPEPLGPKFPYVNAARQVRSLIDGNARIDGYSGNVPPVTVDIEYLASRVPIAQLVPAMRAFGVRYLVLHAAPVACVAGYDVTELAAITESLQLTKGVERVLEAGPDVIAVLAPAPLNRAIPKGGPGAIRAASCLPRA